MARADAQYWRGRARFLEVRPPLRFGEVRPPVKWAGPPSLAPVVDLAKARERLAPISPDCGCGLCFPIDGE